MASFFGEVIHPSSRAFWNDGDDDEFLDDNQEDVEFVIKWLGEEPASFDKLLIVEGEMMTDFVVNCLPENTSRCICTINCESNKYCTNIYAIEDLYVCNISTKLNLALAGQLTLTLVPLLKKSKQLLLLTAEHVSHFKSEEGYNSASFLKSLCTQKARNDKNSKNVSSLNQPNIITGVCAGVLSYAEVADLHCTMYVLYTDTFTLDSKNSLPLCKLFLETFGKLNLNFSTGDTTCFNKGNLYM